MEGSVGHLSKTKQAPVSKIKDENNNDSAAFDLHCANAKTVIDLISKHIKEEGIANTSVDGTTVRRVSDKSAEMFVDLTLEETEINNLNSIADLTYGKPVIDVASKLKKEEDAVATQCEDRTSGRTGLEYSNMTVINLTLKLEDEDAPETVVDLSSVKSYSVIDLTTKQEDGTTAEDVIDLTTEFAEAFIDLTINLNKEDLDGIVIDLTNDEDETYETFDLTIQEDKSIEWWDRRKDSLRRFTDNHFYTIGCLEWSSFYIQYSNRYKTPPNRLCIIRVPIHQGKWLRKIDHIPKNKLIMLDLRNFPYSPGLLRRVLSTLQSFAHRVSRIMNNSKSREDRACSAFDTLSYAVFHEIVASLLKYTENYISWIPRDGFPDLELLEISKMSLQRAGQFFQYIQQMPGLFVNDQRMYNDMWNINAMDHIVSFIMEQMKLSELPKEEMEQSDLKEEMKQEKVEENIDTDEVAGSCKIEAKYAAEVKQEGTDSTVPALDEMYIPAGNLDLNEPLFQPKVEITVQLNRKPQEDQLKLGQQAVDSYCRDSGIGKGEETSAGQFTIPAVKREQGESLMASYLRSSFEYD